MQVRMLRASLKQLEGSCIDAAVIEKACALVAGSGTFVPVKQYFCTSKASTQR
jgi:hypothetical protein